MQPEHVIYYNFYSSYQNVITSLKIFIQKKLESSNNIEQKKKTISFKLKKQKNLIILNRKIKIIKLYNNIEQKNKNRKIFLKRMETIFKNTKTKTKHYYWTRRNKNK